MGKCNYHDFEEVWFSQGLTDSTFNLKILLNRPVAIQYVWD